MMAGLLIAAVAGCGSTEPPHVRDDLRSGEVYGIDVSNHQGRIDWAMAAKDHTAFAYLKASEGGDFTDRRFSENWDGARDAGLLRGAYHFFTLCRPGVDQAENFLRSAPPQVDALPPAVDLEFTGNCPARPGRAAVRAELNAFLGRVEQAWGRRALLYVGRDWEQTYPVLTRSDRQHWLVSFPGRPQQEWTVWQLHGHAQVNGVHGPVDLDVARLEDLQRRVVPGAFQERPLPFPECRGQIASPPLPGCRRGR